MGVGGNVQAESDRQMGFGERKEGEGRGGYSRQQGWWQNGSRKEHVFWGPSGRQALPEHKVPSRV